MELAAFQRRIEALYLDKDRARGVGGTWLWFTEEVGELAEALRLGDRDKITEEVADVLAWLSTLASLSGVELDAAVAAKYGDGCPKCGAIPCNCAEPGSSYPT